MVYYSFDTVEVVEVSVVEVSKVVEVVEESQVEVFGVSKFVAFGERKVENLEVRIVAVVEEVVEEVFEVSGEVDLNKIISIKRNEKQKHFLLTWTVRSYTWVLLRYKRRVKIRVIIT